MVVLSVDWGRDIPETNDSKTQTINLFFLEVEKKAKMNIYEEKKKKREYEAMQAGTKRAGKEWARRADHKTFHPLGMVKAKELFKERRLFFDYTEEKNIRKAHCKICGKELKKDEGIRMPIYAQNFFNLSFYYCCERCHRCL